MSSKNRKNNKNNNIQSNKAANMVTRNNKSDDEMDEVDKILEQLDEMEKKNQTSASAMSSRVKNLIKEDKEAIKEMQEKLKALEDEELDYLDDEKVNDEVSEESGNNISEDVEKTNIAETDDLEKKDEKTVDKPNRNRGKKAKKKQREEKAKQLQAEQEKEIEEEKTDNEEESAKLDFFANLEKEDRISSNNIYAERIRKKQPKKLKTQSNSIIDKIKDIARDNKKNFFVGSAIAVLFILLVIALVIDADNKLPESKGTNSAGELRGTNNAGEFIDINTAGMVDAVSGYYDALISGDIELVRGSLINADGLSDAEIMGKINEAKAYSELVGDEFKITGCYVQKGLREDEYICYMKFELKFRSIETPAVGVFTCYLKGEDIGGEEAGGDKGKIQIYKFDNSINDSSTDVYKYIIKMSKCSNVTELFEAVNAELEAACAKDADLRSVVDAISQTKEEEITDNETTQSESKEKETEK